MMPLIPFIITPDNANVTIIGEGVKLKILQVTLFIAALVAEPTNQVLILAERQNLRI
jgi:hypothetical protein